MLLFDLEETGMYVLELLAENCAGDNDSQSPERRNFMFFFSLPSPPPPPPPPLSEEYEFLNG